MVESNGVQIFRSNTAIRPKSSENISSRHVDSNCLDQNAQMYCPV